MNAWEAWKRIEHHAQTAAEYQRKLDELEAALNRYRGELAQRYINEEKIEEKKQWVGGIMRTFTDLPDHVKNKLAAKAPAANSDTVLSVVQNLNTTRERQSPAQREQLYSACCSALKYLARRQTQLESLVEERLDSIPVKGSNETAGERRIALERRLKAERQQIREELTQGSFAKAMERVMKSEDLSSADFPVPETETDCLTLWQYPADIPADVFPGAGSIRIPDTRSMRSPFTLLIQCEKANDSAARSFALRLCLKLLRSMPPVENRVFFLDGVSHNPGNWRFPGGQEFLEQLAADEGFVNFPLSADSEEYVFDKLDRLNPLNCSEQSDPRLLIAYGYPSRLSSHSAEAISDLIANSKQRGVSVVLIAEPGNVNGWGMRHKAQTDYSLLIREDGRVTLSTRDGDVRDVELLPLPNAGIGRKTRDALVQKYSEAAEPPPIDYFERVHLPKALPPRRSPDKRYRAEMPVAVDKETGRDFSAVFDLKDSAFSYFYARSGGGKTSFLHMMIADLLCSFHPDDLELWLLDLKGVEFQDYEKLICDGSEMSIPHIRYILSAGSEEVGKRYVLDILDRLNEEMEKRVSLLANPKFGKKEPSELPEGVYFPLLIVFMDEYAVVDRMIGNNATYQNHLRRLIDKGRQQGICMLFASQHLDTAAMGESFGNIQTRIGMEMPDSEGGLKFYPHGMPKPKIGQASLPNYHSIYARRENDGVRSYYLQHYKFIKEKGDVKKLLGKLGEMLKGYRGVRSSLYLPQEEREYVKKAQGFVSPVTTFPFSAFQPILKEANTNWRRGEGADLQGRLLVHVGKPCSFDRTRSIKLGFAKGENILAIIRNTAGTDSAVLVPSTVAALLLSAKEDGAEAELWCSENNEAYSVGANKDIWKDIPRFSGAAARERLLALNGALPRDGKRHLVVLLDVCQFIETISDPPGNAADCKILANALDSLIAKAPYNGWHFVVQINDYADLGQLQSLSGSMKSLPSYSVSGYKHLLTGQLTGANKNINIPFMEMRANLTGGLLFYSADNLSVIYNPFDFDLRRERYIPIDSVDR